MPQRLPLSGDSNAKFVPFKLTPTTNGTAYTVHTATSATSPVMADMVWLKAWNVTANTVRLTLLKGGTAEPGQAMYVDIPPAGNLPTLVLDGMPLKGGLLLKAFASVADALILDGYVDCMQVQ